MILRTGEEKAIIDFHVDYPPHYYWDLPTIFPLFYKLDMVLG